MGKGIAAQFKKAWPEMFRDYAAACKRGDVQPGTMHVWSTGQSTGPSFIINFPTKRHWRSSSRMEDIENGLVDLTRVIKEEGIDSIAIHPSVVALEDCGGKMSSRASERHCRRWPRPPTWCSSRRRRALPQLPPSDLTPYPAALRRGPRWTPTCRRRHRRRHVPDRIALRTSLSSMRRSRPPVRSTDPGQGAAAHRDALRSSYWTRQITGSS